MRSDTGILGQNPVRRKLRVRIRGLVGGRLALSMIDGNDNLDAAVVRQRAAGRYFGFMACMMPVTGHVLG